MWASSRDTAKTLTGFPAAGTFPVETESCRDSQFIRSSPGATLPVFRIPESHPMPLRHLLALLAMSVAAGAEPPLPLVATAPLATTGTTDNEAAQIAEALATSLQKTGKIRLLERSQADRILAEQGFQASGACDAGSCAVEIGKLLGVERLVVGSLGKIDRTYQLNLRLVDVGTGEVLASSTRQGAAPLGRITRSLVDLATRDLVSGGAPPGDARPSGLSPWVWWGAGTLAASGVAAAVILSGRTEDAQPAPTPADPELRMILP